MMRKVFVACAVLLAFAFSSPARAGIPIPCTATHFLKAEDVRVMDAGGQEMAPYYNVFGCSDRRWGGYRGADGKYHPLTPNMLSSLPEPPGFWASAWQNKAAFWVEWLWIVLGVFVVIGTLLSKLPDILAALPAGVPPPVHRR
jgi:hypothetical protein